MSSFCVLASRPTIPRLILFWSGAVVLRWHPEYRRSNHVPCLFIEARPQPGSDSWEALVRFVVVASFSGRPDTVDSLKGSLVPTATHPVFLEALAAHVRERKPFCRRALRSSPAHTASSLHIIRALLLQICRRGIMRQPSVGAVMECVCCQWVVESRLWHFQSRGLLHQSQTPFPCCTIVCKSPEQSILVTMELKIIRTPEATSRYITWCTCVQPSTT